MNSNDDRGILEGRWHGSYQGGVSPTEWSGSANILQCWASSDCSPVRYGQCWVFASVLCTGTSRMPRLVDYSRFSVSFQRIVRGFWVFKKRHVSTF